MPPSWLRADPPDVVALKADPDVVCQAAVKLHLVGLLVLSQRISMTVLGDSQPVNEVETAQNRRGRFWKRWDALKPKLFNRRVAVWLIALTASATMVLYWALFVRVSNAGLTFDRSLWIPPQLIGERHGERLHFDLKTAEGSRSFLTDVATKTAGVNGDYLGPTVRVRRGDAIDLAVTNGLSELTTMHWHGMHVPAQMDGTPHQPIEPGQTWTASFEVDQQAATLWYHPHTHGRTGRQAYQGITGLLYVDDKNSESLDLPNTYGVDDVPIVIQDKLFGGDGQFRFSLSRGAMYGDTILINGTWNPRLAVESRLIRFRLLNGSNARIYYLGFEDDRPFHQIATDGGFLETPVRLNRVTLAPGERAEILVDFSDGRKVKLKSFPEAGLLETAENFFDGAGNGHFELLEIVPEKRTQPSHSLPGKMNSIVRIREEEAAKSRPMLLAGGGQNGRGNGTGRGAIDRDENERGQDRNGEQGSGRGGRAGQGRVGQGRVGRGPFLPINGKTMDMHRVDERVRLNDIEIWDVRNRGGQPHPFHVHLVQFQVLDRNGRPPEGSELGWKDTVLLHPGDRVRLIMQFERYADPKFPYMYHCHIMEHEDAGMMGQFLVVEEPPQWEVVRGKTAVIVFVLGLDCDHCFEQVRKFDREIDEQIPLVFVTPESQPEPSRLQEVSRPVVSDPDGKWAGWLGLLHDGPFHGTVVVDVEGDLSWKSGGEEPYMDVGEVKRQFDRTSRVDRASQ